MHCKGFCSVCPHSLSLSKLTMLRALQFMHALLTNPEVLNTVSMYPLIGISDANERVHGQQ